MTVGWRVKQALQVAERLTNCGEVSSDPETQGKLRFENKWKSKTIQFKAQGVRPDH